MTKILITEFINQNSLENLNKKFDVNYDEKLCEDGKEIIKIIRDYDGLIVRNKTQVNSDILKKALKLKFIGRLGIGLDNLVYLETPLLCQKSFINIHSSSFNYVVFELCFIYRNVLRSINA